MLQPNDVSDEANLSEEFTSLWDKDKDEFLNRNEIKDMINMNNNYYRKKKVNELFLLANRNKVCKCNFT